MSEVGPVDDRTALPLCVNQSGPREDREVRGHGVVGHGKSARDLPGRQSIRLVFNQEPEGIEPGALR